MFMIAGLKYGYVDPKDMNAKKEHYELVQKLVERFKEENGSIICRELLDSMWFMTNLNLRKGRRVIIKSGHVRK